MVFFNIKLIKNIDINFVRLNLKIFIIGVFMLVY